MSVLTLTILTLTILTLTKMIHRLKYQVQSSCYWRRLSWPGLPRHRSRHHRNPGSIQAYHHHWSYQDSKYLRRQNRRQSFNHLNQLRISAWTRSGAAWECSRQSSPSWPSARAVSCAQSRPSCSRGHPRPNLAAIGQAWGSLGGKFCRSARQWQANLRRAADLAFAGFPASASGLSYQWSHSVRRGDTVWPAWTYRQTLGRSRMFRLVYSQLEVSQCVFMRLRGMSWRWIASSTTAQWSSWTKFGRYLCTP